MVRVKSLFLSIALLCLPASVVQAGPVLTFEFLGSGQTFAPTDNVRIQGKITNIGDADLVNAFGLGSINFRKPTSDQYQVLGFNLRGTPAGSVDLAIGESIIWDIATLYPWPLTGARYDPVPLGQYEFLASWINVHFELFDNLICDQSGCAFESIAIPQSLSNFVWTVAEPRQSVPEAGMVGVFLLSAMAFVRRKVSI